ncbi:hypothetical protein ISU10_20090 [Nocardioides agariphilus]|uniref:Membrane protein YczE n=1 Tax=Nocardioides agariphilus TaxID=433664 RepID=A0A930VUE2_9ACTN|nr:hypothetical protein [Nocardioides agariphilus]
MSTAAPALVHLGPLAQLRAGRLTRRLVQLLVGLVMYGVSVAMMVRGGLGVAPWDVLTSGFVRHVSISFGQAVIAISFVVLLFWLPLRETPGIGTLANAFLIGLSADATLAVLSQPASLVPRAGLMLGGIALCGLATAVYIGAQLGRGPRDGLMTGLARRTGLSLRLVRTALEVTVVLVGVALGGQLGIGTVLFAVTIGPIAQALLPVFLVSVRGD